MLFYDVNVLEVPEFVDQPIEVPLVVAVKLLVVGEVGHLVVKIVGYDTKLTSARKENINQTIKLQV